MPRECNLDWPALTNMLAHSLAIRRAILFDHLLLGEHGRLVREGVIRWFLVDINLAAKVEVSRVECTGGDKVFACRQKLVVEMRPASLAERPDGPF